MALKFVAVLGLAMMAAAVPVEHHGLVATGPAIIKSYAPAVVKHIATPIYKQIEYEHEAPAEYEFSYGVHDEHTGDVKSQQESRKGDVVHGRYELVEPDGHKRIVEYTADKHNGFNAVVSREQTHIRIPEPAPQIHKVIAAPVAHYAPVAKVAYAAPAITKVAYAAPTITKVAYAAPVAKVAYAAPVHAAPIAHYSTGHEIAHFGYAGPISNYIHH